ncbi:fatty acid desaturase [Patulibacter minatonensis]|uniref:fatty acid desaturase n=1 Tax=Patulibacter minatonensis TaxID=298163 RepID=UPI000686E4E1
MGTAAIPGPHGAAGDGADDHHDHGHSHGGGDAPEVTPASWTDGKRYAWLLGLIVPISPFIAYGLVEATGLGVLWWLGPLLVFALMPVLDTLIGTDAENPPDRVLAWLEQDRYYRWCTYLYVPLQYASLVFACVMWASGDLSVVESIGLAATVGCVSGFAINAAHELGHKRDAAEKWLSKIALAQTGYGHFFVEHNRGHHVRVATPEDPASSRLGQSFWVFLPRTVYGSATSSWHLERERFRRLGTSPWTFRNDLLNAWAMTVVGFVVLVAAFGVDVVPYLLLQGVIGFSLLEIVNYLEHYGLVRQQKEDGRYERTRPEHSWNSNNVASNVFLFHLQRHSDHHAHPTRRYQALRHFEEAPQLPSGYATMILLALFPPIWRRVMDHRVLAHYGGDVTRANIHPRRRGHVLAKYGPGTKPAEEGARVFAVREAADERARLQAEAEAAAAAAQAEVVADAYSCPICDYVYEVAAGDPRNGVPAGTAWSGVPDDWNCPECGVRDKADFVPVTDGRTAVAAGGASRTQDD